MQNKLFQGDCLLKLDELLDSSVDLVYIDPPFFSQKNHTLSNRLGDITASFSDKWDSSEAYCSFLRERLLKLKNKLKKTGSLFFHCDNSASHLIRFLLDEVFGNTQFRSKIIWTYKRWSNAQKGLLPAYQEIFFYSKSNQFKFNKIYNNYSPTTNVDQILQKRVRDNRGKTVYAKSEEGLIISSDEKLGVPLSDVWEIPFLNPKASERVGYPTQKPILLLEKIIQLTTSEGDTVLDPFCGSGTTLVASKLLNRQFVGIDISEQAIKTTQNRLDNPIKTSSKLCENGVDSYYNTDNPVASYLPKNSYSMVHRNKGIDAILTQKKEGKQVLVRVQRQWESLAQAAMLLLNASLKKTEVLPVLIITRTDEFLGYLQASYPSLCFLNSIELQLSSLVATDLPLSNEINVGSSAR